MKTSSSRTLGRGFLASWVIFFAIWLAATASMDPAAVVTGVILTCGVAHQIAARTSFWAGLDLRVGRLWAGARYLLVFGREMISSNVAVLGYVYAPRVSNLPKIVSTPVRVTGPRERLALTNTITLTPGTLVIDLNGDHVDMHVLDERMAPGVPESVATFENLLERTIG